MNVLKISDLTPHPKNDYFFDDVSGEKWERLLESIKRNGVRTPIIVTDSMVIVSGNQRVRACKELGILTINGEVVHYANDDDVIRDLIEINIRQRGVIDDSEIKQGRRFRFLQDYYGVQHGGDRKSESRPNNSDLKTQKQIADESSISVDTMNNYIKLSEMIPEMQELLESGTVTKTTALSIARKLSTEEQKQLVEQLIGKDKVSGSEVQKYIDELKAAREENAKLRTAISEQGARNAELQHKLENRPPARVEIKEVEVPPADYKTVKAKAKEADNWKANYDRAVKEKQSAVSETLELKSRIRAMENQTAEAKTQFKLEEDSEYFAIRVYDFIKKNGGYVWIFDKINELPEEKRQNFVKAICALDAFTKQMTENIGEYVDG